MVLRFSISGGVRLPGLEFLRFGCSGLSLDFGVEFFFVISVSGLGVFGAMGGRRVQRS